MVLLSVSPLVRKRENKLSWNLQLVLFGVFFFFLAFKFFHITTLYFLFFKTLQFLKPAPESFILSSLLFLITFSKMGIKTTLATSQRRYSALWLRQLFLDRKVCNSEPNWYPACWPCLGLLSWFAETNRRRGCTRSPSLSTRVSKSRTTSCWADRIALPFWRQLFWLCQRVNFIGSHFLLCEAIWKRHRER